MFVPAVHGEMSAELRKRTRGTRVRVRRQRLQVGGIVFKKNFKKGLRIKYDMFWWVSEWVGGLVGGWVFGSKPFRLSGNQYPSTNRDKYIV